MRAVLLPGPSQDDELRLAEVPDPVPGPGELLVDVVAAGVNRADLLQRAGHYPPPPGTVPWPGLEVSGRVAALGPPPPPARPGPDSAPSTPDLPAPPPLAAPIPDFRVGDRVAVLLPGGGYAERVTAPAALAVKVDDELDLVDAASLPEALATVGSTLTAAHARPGETLLVRGGSGGIGTVAVQLGVALGMRVVATAGGAQRCAQVRALGAHVVVDHSRDSFVETVLDATGGVDVLLDVLGAAGLADNLAVLADGGRLAVIGLQEGSRGTLDLGLLLNRRATVLGTTLRSRPPAQKAAIMADVRTRLWPLVRSGAVRPVIHARLPLDRADEAHRLMASGRPFGKILLTVAPS